MNEYIYNVKIYLAQLTFRGYSEDYKNVISNTITFCNTVKIIKCNIILIQKIY